MSLDPKLRAASEAAQGWTTLLTDFCYYAERGKWAVALGSLYKLRWELKEYRPTLEAAYDQFAAVSDGTIPNLGPAHQSFPSAHEAVAEVSRLAVSYMVELPGLGGKSVPVGWEEVAKGQIERGWKDFAVPASELRARIRRERAKLLAETWSKDSPEVEGAKQSGDRPKSNKSVSGSAIEALLENEGQQVLTIAQSHETADAKMRAICAIDRRFLGYESPQWAELLGVSDAAIRKTQFWKCDRSQAIGAERELRDE